MYGMRPSPQDPVASYEVATDHLFRNQHPGTRGFAMSPDLLTTGVIGNNNSLVLQSKSVRPKVGAIAVQFGVLGPNAPLALFENGVPATLKLRTNQGYQLAATFPGIRGNRLSLTINLPSPYPGSGVTTPLVVKAVPTGQIVVTLATSGNGVTTPPTVTTTATQLVAALNASPGISRWVKAWISDSTLTGPLTPLLLTNFTGGMDIPYLVYVLITVNTSGVVSTTATQVLNLLKGSRFIGATNKGSSTGAGVVAALGPAVLTGGYLSAGAIKAEDETKLQDYRYDITPGEGLEHMTNQSLQVFSDRHGAGRTWQVVPTQDRAIVRDIRTTVGGATIIGVNHSIEHAPRSLYL